MHEVTQILPDTPSINELARIISNVAAPAFLLGAVASFISVLITRINRVIDRARFIHDIPEGDGPRATLKEDLPRLRRRAELLHRSLYYAIISGILTTLIIIVAFGAAMLHTAHEYGVAMLFVFAMLTFCASLVDLARDAKIAFHEAEFRI